jgi:hypothetical protein
VGAIWTFNEKQALNEEELGIFVAAYREAFLMAASVGHEVHALVSAVRCRAQAAVTVASLGHDGPRGIVTGGLFSWANEANDGKAAAHKVTIMLRYERLDAIEPFLQANPMGWDCEPLHHKSGRPDDPFSSWLGWHYKLPPRRARR